MLVHSMIIYLCIAPLLFSLVIEDGWVYFVGTGLFSYSPRFFWGCFFLFATKELNSINPPIRQY